MKEKKEKWISFVEDINNSLQLDPAIPAEDMEDAIQDIVNRQDGDDSFVDEDYVPENAIGLKDSTVAWLIENDVPVPETWTKRLKKQAIKAKAKAEPEPQQEESKPAKAKEAKAKIERKPPERKKTRFGHILGSMAETIDNLLVAGATDEDAEKAGVSVTRFHGHIKHINKDKADIGTVAKDEKTGIWKATFVAEAE